MIDISKLKLGDLVRNIGSGSAYVVGSIHFNDEGEIDFVLGIRTIEISNPVEWELVDHNGKVLEKEEK